MRCLPFAVVLVLILRKSVKSLQNVVNEAMAWLMVEPVTASAFSQARYKLQHTAFIELNQQAVVESRYREANFRTFWGFRVSGDRRFEGAAAGHGRRARRVWDDRLFERERPPDSG